MPQLRDRLPLYERLKGMLQEVRDGRMLIEDTSPDTQFTMTGGNIVRELGLDKSGQNTLRSYLWALKNNTGNYKKLADYMNVDGDYLCLNPEYVNYIYVAEVDTIEAPKQEVIW